MKRLVYAPKVWIFIRSSNQGGRIYDVSSDIVRGSITQNLGDVSTLEFELRNRYKKWLRETNHSNVCIFLPMDLVTIWMQRIAGRPIQVFTGYLDEVPYYQSYPGNAIFKATCTLKKLAFMWFDPGLPMFQTWVFKQHLWALNPETGDATGLQSLTGGSTGAINDSGMGTLLHNFMTDIAGWDSDEVIVGGMPAAIAEMAAKILHAIETGYDSKVSGKTSVHKDQKDLTNFMKQYLDIDGIGGSPVNSNNDVTIAPGTGAPPTSTTIKNAAGAFIPAPKLLAIVDEIDTSASRNNIPPIVLVMAGFLLSNLDPNYQEREGGGSSNWGYGLYALRPNNVQNQAQANRIPLDHTDPAAFMGDLIDGISTTNILDIQRSSDALCRRLNTHTGPWVEGAKNNDAQAMIKWIEEAIGRAVPTTFSPQAALDFAKQATYSQMAVTPVALPIDNIDPHVTSLEDASVQSQLTPLEKQVLNENYREADPIISKIILTAKQVSPNIRISKLPDLQPNEIYFNGPAGAISALYLTLTGDSTNVFVQTNASGRPRTLRSGVESGLPARSDLPGTGILVSVDKSLVHADAGAQPGGAAGAGGAANKGDAFQLSLAQLAVFSFDASFAANFAFPTNVQEAAMLRGDKALLNDTDCLTAVKQFCQGSLRTFRSLPDGRFLAFYPDYFGGFRNPYWRIYNIEMIDFGIQLNDDALATHVYVVGDTLDPTDPNNFMNEVRSRGVATVNQAGALNFIVRGGGDISISDPLTFLNHYGSRPLKEPEPMIRSSFYEYMLAWQRFMMLWSQQFATNVQFTFQPEVMAGGLIEFPDHNVQMFVESVTHNFDYTQGFTTDAVLSAPALNRKADAKEWPGFVLALPGSINSVGVGSGA